MQNNANFEDTLAKILTDLATIITMDPSTKGKLKSRKFWIAVAGILTGIGTLVGIQDKFIAVIGAAVMVAASVVGYFIAEGSVDGARSEERAARLSDIMGAISSLTIAVQDMRKESAAGDATQIVQDGIETDDPVPESVVEESPVTASLPTVPEEIPVIEDGAI